MKSQILKMSFQLGTVMSLAGAIASATLISGCGAGMHPYSSTAASSANTGSGTGSGTQTWQSLSMNGSPARGDYKSVQIVSIDKVTKELVLTLPMPLLPGYDGSPLSLNLNQPPGSKVSLAVIDASNMALTLRVPLIDIIRKPVSFPPATQLPNGDPLPAVADGSLPSAAMTISQLGKVNATVYFSVQQLAFFVSTPFDPTFSIQIPIMNETNTRTWGYLTSVPAKTSPTAYDGGFFVSIKIPDDIARVIDDNL